MSPPLVISETPWQPIVLIETGEPGLVMLVLKTLPTESALQLVFRVCLQIRHHVQRVVHLHATNLLVPDLVNHDVDERELVDRTSVPEPPPDVREKRLVNPKVSAPLFRLATTLRRKIRAGNDVSYAVLPRELVET
jgi:hypothetical protein